MKDRAPKAVERQLQEDLTAPSAKLQPPSKSADPSADPIKLENFKAIASYSYLDAESPAILVPGHPPVFVASEGPWQPSKEPHPIYHDQATHRFGSSPLAPLIVAVNHMNPEFNFNDVDLIVDRASLLNLLTWASGHEQKEFRIDLDLAGNTVLMTRWESKVFEAGSKGIGSAFEREITDPTTGTTGHDRIVTFDLLGTKVLLRHPVSASSAPDKSPLDARTAPTHPSPDPSITVHPGGVLAPQSSLIEFVTISKTAKFDRLRDGYELLSLSQTPSLYLARHAKGSIGAYEDVKLSGMRIEEKKAQDGFVKLSEVLGQIMDQVREAKGEKLSLVSNKAGEMQIWEREGGVGLPQELRTFFTPKK